MNGEVAAEGGRPRPLSGGLWTLFSWLRRDDRSSSSDSLSSAGSDRTAISFAFLPPARYSSAAAPVSLPPPAPPTDSYKKRVRDRNIRRQYEKNITLHRKYGLYREGVGYDAFSLPSTRKSISEADRDRRATSECLQRRSAHVPGKRPAPSPPDLSRQSTTLPRRNTRKRRAPPPPTKNDTEKKENVDCSLPTSSRTQMNSKSVPDSCSKNDVPNGCKPEKYSKKDVKVRHDKSFLKQIFENRKRNSAIETSPGKLLPNISELDRQAAEIIEKCKLKAIEQNTNNSHSLQALSNEETWFCTTCLRKYNSTIVTCPYCLPEKTRLSLDLDKNKSTKLNASSIYTQTTVKPPDKCTRAEEKQKLKEMLKEMKDSLPKKNIMNTPQSVQDMENNSNTKDVDNSCLLKFNENVKITEAPTLRIGCTVRNEDLILPSSRENHDKLQSGSTDKPVKIKMVAKSMFSHMNEQIPSTSTSTEPVKSIFNNKNKKNGKSEIEIIHKEMPSEVSLNVNNTKENVPNSSISIHTPLKISSLLNPMYVPKSTPSLNSNIPLPHAEPEKCILKIETITDTPSGSSNRQGTTSTGLTETNVVNPLSAECSMNVAKSTFVEKLKNEKKIDLVNKIESPKKFIITESDRKLVDVKLLKNAPPTTPNSSNRNDINRQTDITDRLSQHSRRRELVNQLEQSIAKGDERAAADAAVKLAQLRLSCSVLSFSSQIIAEPSTSGSNLNNTKIINHTTSKINANNINGNNNRTDQSTETRDICRTTKVKPDTKETKISLELKDIKKEDEKPKVENAQNENTNVASTSEVGNDMVTIQVLIEDKEAARGPMPVRVSRRETMGELRRKAEATLGIATRLQRWIVGRTLCTDDAVPLTILAGNQLDAPFYLCLVESETRKDKVLEGKTESPKTNNELEPQASNVYSELMRLEQRALVPNAESFECGVCMEECVVGAGIVLRECVHTFCRECVSDVIRHSEEPVVSCPAMGCPGVLQEREIRALVSAEEYEKWLARGLAAAESGTRNAFHCRTRDCTGWALCEPGVQKFPCPVCKHTNCLPCQAIHEKETCEQHRARVQEVVKNSENEQTDEGTRAFLNTLISRGEALQCPECSAIITKKWGCDWVKCSACKTEICWVTRGRRWGPGGRGDTSGGCRCGVDGKRCHPSCAYCH